MDILPHIAVASTTALFERPIPPTAIHRFFKTGNEAAAPQHSSTGKGHCGQRGAFLCAALTLNALRLTLSPPACKIAASVIALSVLPPCQRILEEAATPPVVPLSPLPDFL